MTAAAAKQASKRHTPLARGDCERLDAEDPFRRTRELFALPEGVIYLDGNSLGPLPKAAVDRLQRTMELEWGQNLISSWNAHGWFDLPRKAGERIAPLIGAEPSSVVVGDTISTNLFKLLGAALALRSDRKVILSDTGNFPSDLYIGQGLISFLSGAHEFRLVEPDEVEAAIDETVAVLMLTEVDYRTGRLHDMQVLTARAHAKGALTIWDLSHSAGAIAVDLAAAGADFAVGCSYKFMNGGPGAPGFLYVRRDLQETVRSPLAGWWGHAAPFAFDLDYRPAAGIARFQCGTQPILSLAALDSALSVWDGVDIAVLQEKSRRLSELFIGLVERTCGGYGVRLAGPRNLAQRGSQVSFHCPEGYAVMQALIASGVIGDFRAPDLIRFGMTPLYTRFVDIWEAAATLARILDQRLWDRPDFRLRKAVT